MKLYNFILSVSQFIFGDHHCNFEVHYERGKKSTKLKLGNFNFKIFKKYNKNAKKVGFKHVNWTKIHDLVIKIENCFIMSFYTKNALDAENLKNRLKIADGLKKG